MTSSGWVDAAQVSSGFAALAAVWLSVVTARSARRVPLTDAYMGAWQSILDVLAIATDVSRSEPPPKDDSDRLLQRVRAADHQLSVIEATLRVRVYGRAIRLDLINLLIDVLYDNPEIRDIDGTWMTLEDMPRATWADCSDEDWVRVINSIPFASMLVSEVWDLPGRPWDTEQGLLRWYYPTVLQGLNARTSVTAPTASPQLQLAFMLGAYVDAFLLPWIRDASREALMGRIGWRGHRMLWAQRRHRWGYAPPWRRRSVYGGLALFNPTNPDR
ncbi:hypothetical protein ASC77_19960 [Nocardioides sp. Root1257]|uniref:hypothetical protein n=1 Tax=unclassified Nocardioides TaxID=2615069 RepID=UPI0006F80869|nr:MULTISPECIES: hypothetical protein [unclassified Nocardioides]KQW45059.1 hypothetical protein ASC77_19960 [Nocardioides sp. Root1257]